MTTYLFYIEGGRAETTHTAYKASTLFKLIKQLNTANERFGGQTTVYPKVIRNGNTNNIKDTRRLRLNRYGHWAQA